MRTCYAYIAVLLVLPINACAPADDASAAADTDGTETTDGVGPSDDTDDTDSSDGTEPGGPDGDDPGGDDPGGDDPGGDDPGGTDPGGTDPGGTDPGGTDPGGTDPGGTDPGGTDPGGGKLCALFHDEWAYQVATYYEPGEEPILTGIYGTALFEADGTYDQSYRIGGIGNFYSGRYTIDGERLRTYDETGELAFDYRFTCSDALRSLVLILENEDGTPSIVYGLESLAE